MSFELINQTPIDLAERANSRTLLQFRKSTIFLNLLQAFISEVNNLQGGILGVIDKRGPAYASGENLNAIGRIVGQDRIIFDYVETAWFSPDVTGLSIDQAPAWVAGAPLAGRYIADDFWYRNLIEARVSRNFNTYSSVPEILNVIKQALGVDVSFYRIGPMEVQLIIPWNTPSWVANFIRRVDTNNHIDDIPFFPIATTVRMLNTIYSPLDAFAPDVNSIDTNPAAVAA